MAPEIINLDFAVEALKDQVNTYNTEDLSISKIKRAVCSFYGVTNQQLTSKNRTKNITNARHIAMYLCRKILDVPYKEIGNEFGRRDHTTVMEACLKVESNIKTNPLYQKAVEDIENKIQFSPHWFPISPPLKNVKIVLWEDDILTFLPIIHHLNNDNDY